MYVLDNGGLCGASTIAFDSFSLLGCWLIELFYFIRTIFYLRATNEL